MFKDADTASQYSLPAAAPCPETRNMAASCIQCRACAAHCAFLTAQGTPGQLAAAYEKSPGKTVQLAFACSLCGLCSTTCPKALNPSAMFLQWRRQVVASGQANLSAYNGILAYEKKGCSKLFSFYTLPAGCTAVFFPGCTLAGTHPAHTFKAFEYLKARLPDTGMVLDCCTKPSHDLGRQDFFKAMFSEMTGFLLENGVTTVITACPSCHKVFTGNSPFTVTSIYEIMADDPLLPSLVHHSLGGECPGTPGSPGLSGSPGAHEIVIQDPCQARDDKKSRDAVRAIALHAGLDIKPSPFSGRKTLCCGEGGFTGCTDPGLAAGWAEKRTGAAGGRQAMTYCAGCANFLPRESRSFHVLDLVFDRDNTLTGNTRVAGAPFTYINRLKLKMKLKKQEAAVTRERHYTPGSTGRRRLPAGRFILLLLLIAAMAGISGLVDGWPR
ncbi:MAG: (Fe-S)-binding protein [Desulfobacterales bacterium]|nr:(Fe-S)-binding protein [Desulfobacterales bacterium]